MIQLKPEIIDEIVRLSDVYKLMLRRCYSSKSISYKDYGARGITVCDEWQTFPAFCQWALEHGSAKGMHLDRIDNDGPYAPWNCKFVTRLENMQNRRSTIYLEAFGEIKTRSQWSRDERCVVEYHTLKQRLKSGWTVERALTKPSQKRRT